MLKLRCTLPKLVNICLHKSTSKKFDPLTESYKSKLEKLHQDIVGGPSRVFKCKVSIDQTLLRKSSNNSKSIVGTDAVQCQPYSMCHPLLTGLCTICDCDEDL